MSKALVVLSGGQDSVTTLYWAQTKYDEVHAITFDYNQRHSREIDAAVHIVDMAQIASHQIVFIGPVLKGRSPLTDPNQPLEQYKDFEQMDRKIGNRVELTFVPMRNPLFLTIAANRAVCADIRDVITGVCQADDANYPDCRRKFITSLEGMINTALDSNGKEWIHIVTPLMNNSKAETVKLALELPGCWEALAYSHTSYDGAYPPIGKDHATVLRAHGFEEAGYPDPLIIRAWHEGLMDLPTTKNYFYFKQAVIGQGGGFNTLQEALQVSKVKE